MDVQSLMNSAQLEMTTFARSFEFNTGYATLLTSTSTTLHANALVSWMLVFLACYALFALVWKILPAAGLSEGKKPFIAASRCIGTVHFMFVVPMSVYALNEKSADWFDMDYLSVNSPLEYRVIELSVGYFLADFVHFVLFEPDFLMFFHHVFSILMMGSAGAIGRGGAAATGAIVQGEVTNPFQSSWFVAKTANAKRLSAILSPLFTFAFVSVRTTVVPLWTSNIVRSMWNSPNRPLMPSAVVESWCVMAVLMALGGYAWSYALIKGYLKNRKRAAQVADGELAKKQK